MISSDTILRTLSFYVLTAIALLVSLSQFDVSDFMSMIKFYYVLIVYIIVWYMYYGLVTEARKIKAETQIEENLISTDEEIETI